MDTPPSTSGYREEILRRMEERNSKLRPLERIFSSYSQLANDLKKSKSSAGRNRAFTQDFGTSTEEVKRLNDKLSELYKQKSENDQLLIDTSKRLKESEAKLIKITEERDKLLQDKDKMCARIAELEHLYKKANDDRITVNDERTALQATLSSTREKLVAMELCELQLLNKIKELNEQKANSFNAEIQAQEKRQQLKLQEDIAKAIADTTRDQRANSTLSQGDGPTGTALLGDIVPNHPQFKFDACESELMDVCWLNSDQFATAGQDKKIRIWKVESSGKQSKMTTLVGCNAGITRLDIDPETKYILASSSDSGVRLWNVETQRLLSTFRGHQDKVTTVKFHGTLQAVSGGSDRSIRLWDLRAERLIKSYFPGSTINDIAARCQIGGIAWLSGHFDKKIRVWDGRSDQPVQTIELAGKVTSLDIATDGQSILVSTRDGTLSLLDMRNLNNILHIYSADSYQTSSDLSRCIISPGMEYVAAGSAEGHVFVWNLRSTKLEKCLVRGGHETSVYAVRWNPSGRGLLSCDRMKQVVYWT